MSSLSGSWASGELSHRPARRLHSSSVLAWLSGRPARLTSSLPNAGIAARSASVSASPCKGRHSRASQWHNPRDVGMFSLI